MEVERGKQVKRLINGLLSGLFLLMSARGYSLMSGEMGDVLRAVFWFAKIGVGCVGWRGGGMEAGTRSCSCVVEDVLAGSGEVTTVPKWAKAVGVRGARGMVTGVGGESVGRVMVGGDLGVFPKKADR